MGSGPGARADGGRASRRAEARALDRAVLEAIRRGWERPLEDAEFDALAARLYAHQARYNPVAGAWWRAAGARAGGVRGWRDVPPLPVAAYKRARVASFPSAGANERPRFLSSGTGRAGRSRVFLEGLELYEAALLASFRRHALPDRQRMRLLFLARSPRGAPRSSLSHMFEVVHEACGAAGSGFLAGARGVRVAALTTALEAAVAAREPVFLLGPAFAFVHALDGLAARGVRYALPPGSRIFVTGGFKGRSRAVEPRELLAEQRRRIGVPAANVVHEYGMAELASQFYAGPAGVYAGPPWVRWRVLDPLTLEPVQGAPGVLAVWDLANRSGCFALRTEDLARPRRGGFELLGRVPRAAPRGCSLEAESLGWDDAG